MSRKAKKRVGRPTLGEKRLDAPNMVRLSADANKCLAAEAKRQGRSKATVLREIVLKALVPCTANELADAKID